MSQNKSNSSLLEYAVKELKQENDQLKDKIDIISKEEIQKREELLNLQGAALEAAANGIVITDKNGKINWVNTAFTKLTGYSKEETYQENPNLLKSGVHDEPYYEKLWDTISSGQNWFGEMINKRKDGTLYTEEMSITPLKDESGEITNFIAIKHNISKRKENEKNLLINQQSVDQAEIGVLWVNMDSEIIYTNKSILKTWNYTRKEALKLKVSDIDPNWPNKQVFNENISVLRKNESLKFESINKKKDGTEFPVEVSLKLLNYENEEIIVAYVRDISITNAIREIEQLVINTKNLDELLSGMHESINKVIPAPNCFIALLDSKSDLVSFPYFADEIDEKPSPRKKKKGSTEYVINSGKPVRLSKQDYAELIKQNKIESIGALPNSWIGVPLFLNSKSSGALVIQSYDENLEYSNADLDWLSSITNLVANVIEKKNTENIIWANEKKLKSITNSTKDAIITVDSNTNIILWNKAAEKLFGYTEEEVLGKSTFDLIIPERFKEESQERFKKITNIGKDFEGTFDLIAKKIDNTEFEVELSVSLTEIGNSWFITGLWRDVSKKKVLQNSSEKEKEKIIKSLENELKFANSNYNVLNSILEELPQSIYIKDQHSCFTKVNKATVTKFGLNSVEEIIGKKDSDLFNTPNAKIFFEEEQNIVKTGEPLVHKEHEEIMQDGKTSWAQTSKFPLYNSEGKSIGLFGISADLTERKKAEDELRDSHYKFRKLIENSTLGILRLDEQGEIIMANPALIKMLGYNSETEIITASSDKIFSSENSRKRFMQIIKRKEKISGFEEELKKKDGSLVEVRESAWAVQDKSDKILYFEVIVEDITEQNQVLKILHESEFKYRMLIDKLSEAIYLLVDGRFEIVNSKFLDLLELSEEEIYSPEFDMFNFMTEESKKQILERQDKIAAGEGEGENAKYEITILTKSGTEKEVEISVSYLNFNGKIATQGVARDLTEVRKQETQIRHLQKMESIGTLAAGIAHEINTPSQFVNDNLSFLKDAFSDIKPIFESIEDKSENNSLEDIKKSAESADLNYLMEEIPTAIEQSIDGVHRIANIVGAMRDFAHTGPKDKVAADIHNVIRSSITLSKNAWKYIAKIDTDFDDSLPPIVCQPNDINQVFVNMIVNSSHAMEKKFGNSESLEGEIVIKTLSHTDAVEIILTDNGSGMPEKVIKRIFDPFYTTKDVGKGTGQGLAIAYDIIVNKHGGDICVESEEDIGTTFKIILPTEPPKNLNDANE